MQFKIQYYVANYYIKNSGNTDLRGNYLIAKLVVGKYWMTEY